MQPEDQSSDEQQRVALGKAIVIRRAELGLRRRDLQERTGLSYPFVAELEQGSKRMSQRSLDLMANALEVRPAELLAMADALADSDERPAAGERAADARTATPAPEAAEAPAARSAPPAAPLPVSPVAAPTFDVLADYAPAPKPQVASRWFGARRAAQETRARIDELKKARADREAETSVEPAAEAPSGAPAGAPAPVAATAESIDALVEERVREIIRDELRKAGIELSDPH